MAPDPDMVLTAPMDPASVTKASRSAFEHAIREVVTEGARLMCDRGTSIADRTRIADLIERAMATLAHL